MGELFEELPNLGSSPRLDHEPEFVSVPGAEIGEAWQLIGGLHVTDLDGGGPVAQWPVACGVPTGHYRVRETELA